MLRPVELDGGRSSSTTRPSARRSASRAGWTAAALPSEVQVKQESSWRRPKRRLPSVAEELAYFKALPWFAAVRTKDEVNRALSAGAGRPVPLLVPRRRGPERCLAQAGRRLPEGKQHPATAGDVNLSMAFIFLNACEAGQANLTITGLGGWAEAFLRRDASVFIGSLWSINDALAAQFARAFYDCLLGLNGQEAQPVGVAFQAARQAIKAQDPDNPTWLAYVLYGDPNGRVSWDK